MNTTNRVQLTGNLGGKPEVRIFENGNKVARFSVATSEEYTSRSGERTKDTQWHSVSVWGKLAEFAETELNKGSFVSVEGKLVTRHYTDKTGHKRYITEVVASDVLIKQKD